MGLAGGAGVDWDDVLKEMLPPFPPSTWLVASVGETVAVGEEAPDSRITKALNCSYNRSPRSRVTTSSV